MTNLIDIGTRRELFVDDAKFRLPGAWCSYRIPCAIKTTSFSRV